MIKFRDLRADEIDCRVQSVKSKGCILLLYKNARCDMNILDETVGADNWQREHYDCKSNLFCRIGINVNFDNPDLEPRWIWKSDCGAESNTEKQKGEASDSFKRAGFNWGIGRELYTAPFLFAKAEDCNIENGKCNDKFVVTDIKIENKVITGLTIVNKKTKKTVYDDMNKSYEVQRNYQNEKQDVKQKHLGEEQRNYQSEINTYSTLLAKNSEQSAEEWVEKAKEKYSTPKGQADVLIKWWNKTNKDKQ